MPDNVTLTKAINDLAEQKAIAACAGIDNEIRKFIRFAEENGFQINDPEEDVVVMYRKDPITGEPVFSHIDFSDTFKNGT